MLATSIIVVAINWKRYHLCAHPLHIWIVVDYTAVFVFRLLMFVDNGLAAGMGLDFGRQQRYARFCGRVVVLSILSLLLYPFLWAWSIIGTLWFTSAKNCLPEEGQKWGFLIWLMFSFYGLICIACMTIGKWLIRRQAHLVRAQQGISVSEYGVFVDMIRVLEWAFEAAGQEMRGMGQDSATYHPGLYLTPAQREAVEALIQELPKFRLKAVPTDFSECPICLEEFRVGNEVRGLPCAHNFHVECIDEWLRLNVKCPRCRCSVFPNLDLSAVMLRLCEPFLDANMSKRDKIDPGYAFYSSRLELKELTAIHASSEEVTEWLNKENSVQDAGEVAGGEHRAGWSSVFLLLYCSSLNFC
ncbi:E3 ubiquitin-protein ligase SIS3-like [Impatiens glandulifera]|uniref:E3 ubiquitin-protein ligase SIS3-like n=1 Tax=Impatiens glandulifera TaxID=253017 RepID=UPI001FB183BA|nr:E3 ubiquitin-protein ligase SIS3-like [Impatiens glandulifera]